MTKKRARKTAAEWTALVSELNAGGQSMTTYARTRGVPLASLSYWRNKLAGRAPGVSVEPRSKTMFSEVVVVPRARATPPRIEVVTRRGAAIRIEGAFDASLLREVLRVAESC